MISSLIVYTLLLSLVSCAPVERAEPIVSVNISGSGYAGSPTLYGLMIEDINHSIDGGLYGELVQNRAFQIVSPGTSAASLLAWSASGPCSIAVVDHTAPLSQALPNSLAITVSSNSSGDFVVSNSGFGGIGVSSSLEYSVSLYAKVSTDTVTTPINVALVGSNGETLATAEIVPASKLSTSWQQFRATLKSSVNASDSQSTLAFNFGNASRSAGKTVFITFASLFQPTYKLRPNGMRNDLASALKDMHPTFLRFPGGNNIEGTSIETRWKWYETIGPLVDRPGRLGDWTYVNTDGFGLFEYLVACEDLEVEPYMAVYAGYSLDGTNVPESNFQFVVDDAINQIQYAIGDASTNQYAALRERDGHAAPFKVSIIEIGNEDFFAEQTYTSYRWNKLATGISAVFPDLKLMATNAEGDVTPSTSSSLSPPAELLDAHQYQNPTWFIDHEKHFDSATYNRTGQKIFLGEYAVTSNAPSCLYGNPNCGPVYAYPEMAGSIAEATYMTGLERNSDLVFSAAYAPLIGSEYDYQWTPNLITFSPNTVIKSTSYYVQQMFAGNHGDVILPASPVRSPPLYYVCSKDSASGTIFIKATNVESTPITFSINFPASLNAGTRGTATLLSSPDTSMSNTQTLPNGIVQVVTTFIAGSNFTYMIPGNAVLVLAIEK